MYNGKQIRSGLMRARQPRIPGPSSPVSTSAGLYRWKEGVMELPGGLAQAYSINLAASTTTDLPGFLLTFSSTADSMKADRGG